MNAPEIRIVLVRPQIPENIGFIARSMKAFGFSRLVLVAPECAWNGESPAYKTASGSRDLLDAAEIVPALAKAVEDTQYVAGFSRRQSQVERPRIELMPWCEKLAADPHTHSIALVFGPENFGLSSQDKRCCDVLVEIPLARASLSLNLAHAVTVVLYELSRCGFQSTRGKHDRAPISEVSSLVSFRDRRRVLERLIELLDGTNFFKSGRRERQIETMHELLDRLSLQEDEYHFVMGMLTALERRHIHEKN